ncbi:PREDICTED: pathogenesis-related protein PRB1-3 [Tarenaya hassleriana]|uniref:pathogenesis-related protein PRB1-3 n=1 Tax=Tarenaya hassleriana TaxID=28532 RepID=UPI00053C6382|nr:PREDICTED: pathogenesis-related protein PRB1-3 [Tarenaya hassleriana]
METKVLAFFILILTPHLTKCDTSLTLQTQNINVTLRKGNAIQQQFLQPHNTLRAKLGLPPLKWSRSLAAYSYRWAKTRLTDCELIHSHGDFGENLFWGSGSGWSPRDAAVAWASERKNYDWRSNRCKPNRDCLHYTQMVWKNSLRIGCATVVCKTGDTFVICDYDPPGNVVGQKPF